MVWSILILNNYLLLIWNSSLAGHLIILFAKPGNSSFWNKERNNTVSKYSKMSLNETTIPHISQKYSKESSDEGFLDDPMDCSLPGSSVHGILQARILEWVAIPFSRGSFQPKDPTRVSCIAGRFFTVWVTREALFFILLFAKSGNSNFWNKEGNSMVNTCTKMILTETTSPLISQRHPKSHMMKVS